MLTFLLGLWLGTATSAGLAHSGESVSWIRNYSTGLEEARKTNKPVLLVFSAEWCGPCHAMEREVLYDPEVVDLLDKFVCLNVDIDRDPFTAAQYHADTIPRVLILDPSANVLSDRVGYQFKPELVKLLSAIPGDFAPIAAVNARLKEDSDDFQGWMSLAQFYSKLGVVDVAARCLKGALKTTEGKRHGPSREDVLNKLGLQNLKMQNSKEARKAFEQCVSEFSRDGSQCDLALLGLITALASDRKFGDAEKLLGELRRRFPDSPAVERAVKNIQAAQASR